MTHAEFVKALRDAADFFEAKPQLGVPFEGFCYPSIKFGYYGSFGGIDAAPQFNSPDGALYFAKHVGGRVDKSGDDNNLTLTAKRPGFEVAAHFNRDAVCARVQVGIKIEPAHVRPAQPATEEVIVPQREIPLYEWRCPTLLDKKETA